MLVGVLANIAEKGCQNMWRKVLGLTHANFNLSTRGLQTSVCRVKALFNRSNSHTKVRTVFLVGFVNMGLQSSVWRVKILFSRSNHIQN